MTYGIIKDKKLSNKPHMIKPSYRIYARYLTFTAFSHKNHIAYRSIKS